MKKTVLETRLKREEEDKKRSRVGFKPVNNWSITVDYKPVALNLERCKKKTKRRRKSEAELWEAATRGLSIISFLHFIMKLKKVERLCREVWRSCQQV